MSSETQEELLIDNNNDKPEINPKKQLINCTALTFAKKYNPV